MLDARREADDLALALSMETSRSLEAVDLLLRQRIAAIHAANVVNASGLQAYASTRAVHEALLADAARLPQVDLLSLVNAQGEVMNFSRFWPIPEINLSDRDYYKALAVRGAASRLSAHPCGTGQTGPGRSFSRAASTVRTASFSAWSSVG